MTEREQDASRAKMYKALLACKAFLTNELQFDGIDPDEGRAVLYAVESAIEANKALDTSPS